MACFYYWNLKIFEFLFLFNSLINFIGLSFEWHSNLDILWYSHKNENPALNISSYSNLEADLNPVLLFFVLPTIWFSLNFAANPKIRKSNIFWVHLACLRCAWRTEDISSRFLLALKCEPICFFKNLRQCLSLEIFSYFMAWRS